MIFKTTEEIIEEIATRFRKYRKMKKISQEELALMSNVSYGSIKRFERKGEISLHSLTKLCVALDIEDEMLDLFTKPRFVTIDDVIRYGKTK